MNNTLEGRQPDAAEGKFCPHCGYKGRTVDTQTVKAMLTVSLYAIRPTRYFFCRSEGCPVVYFAEDGQQRFMEGELRAKVYQKHRHDDLDDEERLICYCFQHTLGSIRAEWQQTGQSTVVETITRGTQLGQCACDIRNPQGNCCLGDVRRFVRQLDQPREFLSLDRTVADAVDEITLEEGIDD